MRRFLSTLVVTMLFVAGCTSTTSTEPAEPVDPSSTVPLGGDTPGPSTGGEVGDPEADPVTAAQPIAAQLVQFDSCQALLDHYVEEATDLVGPYGLGGGPVFFEGEEMMAESEAMAAEDTAAADGAESAGGESFSTTNVQEEGVDEPDRVKTDGALIVTMVEGGLRVVDVASAEVVGRLPLSDQAWNAELLLSGDDLVILSTGGDSDGGVVEDGLRPAFSPTRTTVTRVDLADPSSPTVTGSVVMEGAYTSARMVDGTVRLVMVSDPTGLRFVQPKDGGLNAEQDALAENRQLLAQSDIDDWIPHLQVRDADGRTVGDVQPTLDCQDIARPSNFAGLSTLSVLTLSIDGDEFTPTSGAGLVAAGDTVYASTDRLIVATSPWGQWLEPFISDPRAFREPEEVATDLHTFDISDPATTSHVASGSVAGTLIGQFALSEVDGVIRVATTTQPQWFAAERAGIEDSQSSLVMLAEEGDDLVETGRVDGLGITERIYAVRYLGPDLATIVTFRETDPLYLIDTSDPTNPTVTGELKIPGFSTYLHPVGDGRLVGVGQDADEDGRTQGLQASLFDVSDVSAPTRLDQVTFDGEGYSPVEYDHRAFLHWAPTGQVVLPAELYGRSWEEFEEDCADDGNCEEPKPFVGAVVLQLDGDTLVEQGRVSLVDADDPNWWGQVNRSIVIDDHLWMVAEDRLLRVTLDGLDDRAIIPLR